VAESREALDVGVNEVALVRLPKRKKRRLMVGGHEGSGENDTEVITVIPDVEEEGVIVAQLGSRADLVPTGTGGGPYPVGPRLMDGPRVRG